MNGNRGILILSRHFVNTRMLRSHSTWNGRRRLYISQHTSKTEVMGHTEERRQQERPLCQQDQTWFDSCLGLSYGVGIFPLKSFSCWLGVTHSDSKLKLAFQEVVRNNPLLQTNIFGKGKDAVFKQVSDVRDLPSLVIETKIENKSKEALIASAKSILAKQKAQYASSSQDAYRFPGKYTVVRGTDHIALVIIQPHQFSDGPGCLSIAGQLYFNQLLPQSLWHLTARMIFQERKELPRSFNEVVFKRKLPPKMDSYEEVDVFSDTCLSPRFAKDNFNFENYDQHAPDAISQLKGFDGDEIGSVSQEILTKCVGTLKENGMTLTTALDALAVKVLARLILINEEKTTGGIDKTKIYGPLIIWTTINGRRMNAVPPSNAQGSENERTQKNDRPEIFPLVGNFTCAHLTKVSFEDALTSPLDKIARRSKEGIDRMQTDETYRLHHVAALAHRTPSKNEMYRCGAICLSYPAFLKKVSLDITSAAQTDFGPIPRFMFILVGSGSFTSINLNIKLPLAALNKEIIIQSILDVARGSDLEILFSNLYK